MSALLLTVVVGSVLGAARTQAATLSFTTASANVGQTVSVSVLVSAQKGESLNGVSARINFPTDKLSLVSLSKAGSIITFWAEEPSFSNSAGVISLDGIVPNPGFSSQSGRVITMVFQVKEAGTATLAFGNASVLANDGQGTNILTSANARTLSLSPSSTQPTAPAPSPTAPSANPAVTPASLSTLTMPAPAPVAVPASAFPIRSSTHPDQTAWYNLTTGTFSWDVPPGSTATRLLVDRNPQSVPTILYESPISEKTITELGEETSYLHVQHKVNGTWQGVGHYRINIDTIPPNDFDITFPHGASDFNPQPVILFNTTDDESGIARYDVRIGDGGALAYAPTANSNPYAIPPQEPGSHVVTVTAFDRAGNRATSVAGFRIEGIDPPEITYYDDHLESGDLLKIIGLTYENSTVHLSVYKKDTLVAEDLTKSNSVGNFSIVLTKRLAPGTYEVRLRAVDARGAQSVETDPITVTVEGGVVGWLYENALAILLALLLLGAAIGYRIWQPGGMPGVPMLRRKRDGLVHQSFDLLRKDLETQIARLREEGPKPLTKKEIAFLERLESDLDEVEAMVEKNLKRESVT